MKKRSKRHDVALKNSLSGLLLAALISVSYVACAETATVHDRGIRIGIIGDQTGTTDLAYSYTVLEQGVDALKLKNPDVVIHVGDLLESSASSEEVTAQFAQTSAILDTLPVDWYMTAGDHDVNPPGFQQDSQDRSREALFQTLYGERVPQVLDHLYYSFDVNDYHFISLYTLEALHSDPRWGNVFLNEITDAQLLWLRDDLEKNKFAKAIVVFLHHPQWYNWSAWQRVHNLLRRYPVAAVIAGHFHYDQNEGMIDGIRYVVVGATGGRTKEGDRDAGDVQHVTLLELKRPGRMRFELISLSDTDPLHFTPRRDMDKIQALDIVLGELWNFASVNPVFLKPDGTLSNACDASGPAKIQINPLGNPTDKSITLKIAYSSDAPEVVLSSAGFAAGQCEQVVGDFECVMARSARIFFANNSSVSVNPFAGTLWEATLGLAGTTPPSVGDTLNFDVRFDYQGRSGPLFLERRVSTPIQACS